jgi:molecular chaperone GrpE
LSEKEADRNNFSGDEGTDEDYKKPEEDSEPETKTGEKDTIIDELNNKYLRLYAEFENYRRRVGKEKEELAKFGNESLLYELLPVIDSLELALKHSSGEENSGLVQGVEMTLKELHRTLDKFGLSRIESVGKEFDPAVHHAMTQVEREDLDEKMVAEELRPGYLYNGKVLRPSLVSVSVRPKQQDDEAPRSGSSRGISAKDSEDAEIKINKK